MEGKKKYFALIIFLFIALTIFTYANPFEDDKEFKDGKDKGQIEQVDKAKNDKEDNKENAEEDNSNNPEDNQVNDNSYEMALAAVEKAETSYRQNDVDAARQLVNKVTDPTKKGELEDRLDEVEAGLEVMALIQELEYQVAKSESKEDLNDAKDYRDKHEIAKKLAALNNDKIKKSLQKRLDKVSKILDDNKAPLINIEDNQAFKEDVTIEVLDEAGNDFTIYLSKDGGEKTEIENNSKTTSDGIYQLTVIDEAFNEKTIRFVVDGQKPEFEGLEDGKHYEEITISIKDLSNTIIKISKDGSDETTVDNGTTIKDEGTYQLTATDEAQNETTITVVVDRNAPTIERTDEVQYPTRDQKVTAKDRYLTAVKVEGPEFAGTYTREDFSVGENNENFEIEFNFTAEGTYTIKATDKIGHVTEEIFTIDKTAPVINGFEKHKYYYNTSIKPELIEENLESYTLNGNAYNGEEITEDGHYELVAIDKSGQKAEVKFAIDKTAPTVTGIEDGKFYNKAVKPVITDENLAYVTIDGLPFIPGQSVKLYGKHKLVAVDKAGNKTTINFTIDTIAPKILLLDRIEYISGKYLPIKPVILEQYIDTIVVKKNGEVIPYEKGQQLTDDADYEITVTDKAGNSTTVNFTMDSVSPSMLVKPITLGVVSELDLNNISVIADLADILNPGLLDKDILLSEDAEFILLKKDKSINVLNKDIPLYKPVTIPEDKIIDEEGEYILVAYDKAYNLTSVKFIVDRSAPVINGVENGKIYNNDVTITVDEKNPRIYLGADTTVTVSKKGNLLPSTYKANEPFTLDKDGEYTVQATDIVNNKSAEYKFIIDKTAPVINIDIKNEVLQSNTPLNVVAKVEDDNLISNSTELKPVVSVKNTTTGQYEVLGSDLSTIDVSKSGTTYKLEYSVTDKAGNTTTKVIETTVTNITYEVRFNKPLYEGTYNGKAHNVPTDAKLIKIKDGVESEVSDAEIIYTSNEEMINAKEYTITATYDTYSATATYKINKAIIEIDFTKLPNKVELGDTLDELSANITTNHFEGEADILDYKMIRFSTYYKELIPVEVTTVEKVTEGSGLLKRIRWYTIYVTVKDEYASNYVIKGSANIKVDELGINLTGVSKNLDS